MHVLEAAAFANLVARKAARIDASETLFAESQLGRLRLGAPFRVAVAFLAIAGVVIALNVASAGTAAQLAATATIASGS
jgi:hypothetical protein